MWWCTCRTCRTASAIIGNNSFALAILNLLKTPVRNREYGAAIHSIVPFIMARATNIVHIMNLAKQFDSSAITYVFVHLFKRALSLNMLDGRLVTLIESSSVVLCTAVSAMALQARYRRDSIVVARQIVRYAKRALQCAPTKECQECIERLVVTMERIELETLNDLNVEQIGLSITEADLVEFYKDAVDC